MKHKAITLVEITISISILIVLLAGVLFLLNPMMYIYRANDITRKKNLDDTKKMLEEYVADTGCYPQPTQICLEGTNKTNCHICNKGQKPSFSYLTKDVCDPKASSAQYLYQVEMNGNVVASCPKWFRMYSVLEAPYNAQEDIWGCKVGGCGVAPQYGYSYLVTSPGAPLDNIAPNNWYCFDTDCHQCGTYEDCSVGLCARYAPYYPSSGTCCNAHIPSSGPKTENCR